MTRVLIHHVVRATMVLLPAVALMVGFALGFDHAYGVVIGGGLVFLDGLGLIYLAGALLDPGASRSKTALFLLMFFKLVLVAFLLWVALSVLHFSGLGIVIGIGTSIAALVYGANRGSSSPEGKRAMEEAEERIKKEMAEQELGDKDADSG
jgi:hypothetical protein